jgi:hypothetical protein
LTENQDFSLVEIEAQQSLSSRFQPGRNSVTQSAAKKNFPKLGSINSSPLLVCLQFPKRRILGHIPWRRSFAAAAISTNGRDPLFFEEREGRREDVGLAEERADVGPDVEMAATPP